jgi:hypothetical protein
MKRSFLLASILALMASMNLNATLLSTLLLPGGSLSNSFMTIDDFAFTRTCGGVGVCAPLDASGIDVTLVNNQIRFAGGFTALSNGGFASSDFLIAYDLSVNPLRPALGAVGLLFNGAVVGDQSFAQVVETVIGTVPFLHVAGQAQVDAPGGPLADVAVLDGPYRDLRIVKDIFLVGSDSEGLGYATISLVDQFYASPGVDPFCTENCDVVPEPATYGTLGLGLIGFYLARRKKGVN